MNRYKFSEHGLLDKIVSPVKEGGLTNIDMILGMDVLSQGGLHITHPNFSTELVFEQEG